MKKIFILLSMLTSCCCVVVGDTKQQSSFVGKFDLLTDLVLIEQQLHEQIEGLRSHYQNIQNEMAQLIASLDQESSQKLSLEEALEKLQEKLAAQDEKIAMQEKKLLEKDIQEIEYKAEIERLSLELKKILQLKDDMATAGLGLQQEIEQLQEKAEAWVVEQQNFAQKEALFHVREAQLTQRVQDLEQQLGLLQIAESNEEALREEIRSLQGVIASLNRRIKSLQGMVGVSYQVRSESGDDNEH